jgi:hypothetical protein
MRCNGDTIVIFACDYDDIRLYLLDWFDVSKYVSVDNQFMDEDTSGSTIGGLIEHLAYMLGIEPYYGESIPAYRPGQVTNHDRKDPGDRQPAVAPWASRQVVDNVVDFSKVVRVIRTGWYP